MFLYDVRTLMLETLWYPKKAVKYFVIRISLNGYLALKIAI